MRARLLLLALGAMAFQTAPVQATAPARGGAQLLPNIQTLPPANLIVEQRGQRKALLLTNELANVQTGPIELYPVANDCDGDGNFDNDRTAYQRIFEDADGDGIFTRDIDTSWTKRMAGCFGFHPTHLHWHFQDYARYSLHRLSDGGLVAANTKVSFCIVDSRHRYPEVPGSPDNSYYQTCGPTGTQGISVGWSDIYTSRTPGQHIDITGVPDGDYCVKSTTDPGYRIVETNDRDNSATVPVHIEGFTITILGDTC